MSDKLFSVIAELADGTTTSLSIRGQSSGDAFRQARDTHGVRRVGRVTEVTAGAAARGPDRGASPPPRGHAPETEPGHRRAATGLSHVISGPRAVVYAPPTGGEQPFRHLKPPPERPRPAAPPPAEPRPTKHAAEVRTRTAVPAAGGSAVAVQDELRAEHRIVKSRRRDGLPYLLQQGTWRQVGGKRVFDITSEQGFEDRAAAERQLDLANESGRDATA